MLAIIGVLAALYAVVSQESETNEGLTGYKIKLIQTGNDKTGISYRVQAAKLRHSACRTLANTAWQTALNGQIVQPIHTWLRKKMVHANQL